jgi:urea carboxylase-associated protein 2
VTAPLLTRELPGGATAALVVRPGRALRITAREDGANVAALLLRADWPAERYSMADTLKAQFVAFLTAGNALYSDMGRVLLSITHDDCGWHDPLSPLPSDDDVRARYGERSYQEARNEMHRSAYRQLLVELSKQGLGPRDLPPAIHFFSRVAADAAGRLSFVPGNSVAGDAVELRAELPTLVLLHAGQHPLDPSPEYAPRAVTLDLVAVPPAPADDPARLFRPENERGFAASEEALI